MRSMHAWHALASATKKGDPLGDAISHWENEADFWEAEFNVRVKLQLAISRGVIAELKTAQSKSDPVYQAQQKARKDDAAKARH